MKAAVCHEHGAWDVLKREELTRPPLGTETRRAGCLMLDP